MTTLLSIGPVQDITQNIVYALPAKAVWLQSLAVVETAVDTTFTTLAASTTGVITSAVFVRCTTGNTKIVLKPQG